MPWVPADWTMLGLLAAFFGAVLFIAWKVGIKVVDAAISRADRDAKERAEQRARIEARADKALGNVIEVATAAAEQQRSYAESWKRAREEMSEDCRKHTDALIRVMDRIESHELNTDARHVHVLTAIKAGPDGRRS